MKDWVPSLAVSLVGLLFMSLYLWSLRDWWITGDNDFPAFYAGATLLDGGDLYDEDALHEAETAFLGTYAQTHGYMRPPFHAALIWPLTRLPYVPAFYVYSLIQFACLIYFIAAWPLPGGLWQKLPFCLLATPVFLCFASGEDLPLLLAILAGAAVLHRSGRPFSAGMLFSLGAMKPHLFLLAPIWVFARRDWPFLKGVLTGGAVLTAASFALAGWDWPLRMFETATKPEFTPNPHLMPNVTALLLDVPAAEVWYAVGVAAMAAVCWYVSREDRFEVGLAAVLLGGVLFGRHSYILDCALWLPAGLTLMCSSRTRAMRLGAVALLLPFTYLLGPAGRPTAIAALAALGLAAGMAVERLVLGPRAEAAAEGAPAPATAR